MSREPEPPVLAEAHQAKRQKKPPREKKKKPPRPNQCELYLEQKNRRCAMLKKQGLRFCADHTVFLAEKLKVSSEEPREQDRVPCPLDPKHSVKVTELDYHLRKCNARPPQTHEPWYKKDFNAEVHEAFGHAEKNQKDEKIADALEPTPDALQNMFRVLDAYDATLKPLPKKVHTHAGLDAWYEQKGNKKHVTQQASLVAALKEHGMLSSSHLYVEFGCGKAELSRMVNACVVHDLKTRPESEKTDLSGYGYALVDRGKNRMKMDSKIVADCEESAGFTPQIKRSRIDIQHLDLDVFLLLLQHTQVVGILKHLCGAATDLTLKLVMNSETTKNRLHGLVVAMCCRHVCDYRQLLPLSRTYLSRHGVTDAEAFSVLKRIVTWAVCGRMEGRGDNNHLTGLSYDERERYGLIARRLIDESRVFSVNEGLVNHRAELFLYADKETTLENHCLRVTRKEKCENF